MIIQRSIPLLLEYDEDVVRTVLAFTAAKNLAAVACHNSGGKPLGRIELHKASYRTVRESTGLPAQMACSVMRAVAAAYAVRDRKRRENARKGRPRDPERPDPPICFDKSAALFLAGIGSGKDASFKADGTLSIATLAGRKRVAYRIPEHFAADFAAAVSADSITISLTRGTLRAAVTVTLEALDPSGTRPVGVDLNESNLVVAVDSEGREFTFDGRPLKARNKRARQVRKRLQKKLATLKAEGKDTHSVRRALNRLGEHQSNRTQNYCRLAAARLVEWAGPDAVLVLEDLRLEPARKTDYGKGKSGRRRLNTFPHRELRTAIESRCERGGIPVESVDPAWTSQRCNACGGLGVRHRHEFDCPHCGHHAHADINAARNIRDRFAGLRSGGVPSVPPGARSCGQAVAV